MNRIMNFAAAAALTLLFNTYAYSTETLCNSSEEVVFSCPTKRGKTISVCALTTKPAGARISYRLGASKKIDLELIADTSQDSPLVEGNQSWGSRAYANFLRFRTGDFAYVVQNRWDGCPWPGETRCEKYSDFDGVTVTKSEKLVTRLACSAPGGMERGVLSRLLVPVSENWPE
jgi:hypothetical protein